LDGVTQFRTAIAWQQKDEPDAVTPWFLRDAPGFQIVPELAPTPDEAVFDKIAMSAFEGTPLTVRCGTVGFHWSPLSGSQLRSASSRPPAMLQTWASSR
jgi:hypothetical protein